MGWKPCIFYPGDGDVMLARPDGSAGVWQHEFSCDYDDNDATGPLSFLISKAIQSFLPTQPTPVSRPPDCVARRDGNILVELKKEIEWAMARA